MRTVVFATLVVLASPAVNGLSAQIIRGRVIDAGTQRAVREAEVALADTLGGSVTRTLTDSIGRFRFGLLEPGTYVVTVRHIAYEQAMSGRLALARAEEIEIQLRMGMTVIPIDPVEVVARRPERFGRLSEYYERKEWMEKTGLGRFITREQIERRLPPETSDLLRMIPSVRVNTRTRAIVIARQGGGCIPAVFVDGMHMNRTGQAAVNDYVQPSMIEGIEVYRGASETPPQYQDHGGCGSILIWTRRGEASGKPWSWWRAAIGGGLFLGLILLVR